MGAGLYAAAVDGEGLGEVKGRRDDQVVALGAFAEAAVCDGHLPVLTTLVNLSTLEYSLTPFLALLVFRDTQENPSCSPPWLPSSPA